MAGLLAGGALLALIRHRRRQFRYRSPGRSITQTPAELQDAERALLTAGAAGMGDVNFLDRALRGLTRTAADGRDVLPDVVAARLTNDALGPHPRRPEPRTTRTVALRRRRHHLDSEPRRPATNSDADDHRVDVYAPYPTLVSVGHTEAGEQWLLDLEQVGYLSLTGDTDRCMDLARFIAAELAHNAWSDMVDVTLVGFGAEMTALQPGTAHPHRPPRDGRPRRRPGSSPTHRRTSTATRASVLDARSHPGLAEVPTPHVTLISPTAARVGAAQRALGAGRRAPQSTGPIRGRRGRRRRWVGRTERRTERRLPHGPRMDAPVDDEGMLSIPALGARLIAQQLPEREAADLAALLALAAATEDHPMPASRGDQPWEEYADAAGSPLPQLTIPDAATGESADLADPVEATSLSESALPLPPRAYLDRTAADQADLDTLAPRVPDTVRERIEKSDTDLDVDLADWYDDTTTRPRVSVLGPIQVRAQGDLPPGRPRLAWHTEVVTYLATRPRGATVEAFGTALWPDDPDIVGTPEAAELHLRRPQMARRRPDHRAGVPARRPPAAAAAPTGSSAACWTRNCSAGSGSAASPAARTASPTCGPRWTWSPARRSTGNAPAGTGGWSTPP